MDRFFQSDPNAKWLFPDMVRDAVVCGMTRKPVYPGLIIRDERVASTAFDVPYVQEDELEEELRTVAEGAAIPESAIKYGDRVIKLDKKGRGVIASYEVIRRMSVDMLRIHLQRIGERLGRHLDARLAGSGRGRAAGSSRRSRSTPQPRRVGLCRPGQGFRTLTLDHYFTPTHMLANADLCQTILELDAFKAALFDFAKTGNLPTPLGTRLVPMAGQPPTA